MVWLPTVVVLLWGLGALMAFGFLVVLDVSQTLAKYVDEDHVPSGLRAPLRGLNSIESVPSRAVVPLSVVWPVVIMIAVSFAFRPKKSKKL